MAVCSIYLVMSASYYKLYLKYAMSPVCIDNYIHFLLCLKLFFFSLPAASPSHGDVYLPCGNLPYTNKGTVFVCDATLGLDSQGGYVREHL